MEWISVEKELPPKDVKVLVFWCEYMEVAEYSWDEDEKPVFFNPPSPPIDNVTHWMYLPLKPV